MENLNFDAMTDEELKSALALANTQYELNQSLIIEKQSVIVTLLRNSDGWIYAYDLKKEYDDIFWSIDYFKESQENLIHKIVKIESELQKRAS